jgi:hypothetical protein
MIVIDRITQFVTANSATGIHNVSSQDAVVVIIYTGNNASSSIQYNGNTLVPIVSTSGTARGTSICVMLNPPVGDSTWTVVGGTAFSGVVMTLLGVDKTNSNFVTASNTFVSTTPTLSIQPEVAGGFLISAIQANGSDYNLSPENNVFSFTQPASNYFDRLAFVNLSPWRTTLFSYIGGISNIFGMEYVNP